MNNYKMIDLVIPVLNEENYIEDCITSLLNQSYGVENFNIIIVDGGSTDKTKEIVKNMEIIYKNITVIENTQRLISISMNMAINQSEADIIIRIDAHSTYSPDYVEQCIHYLKKTKSDNVGGPAIPVGKSFIQETIAASYYSKFALGGAKYHNHNFEGFVDSVSFGTFKRETLLKIGLYDERLVTNEDYELNYRIIKNGGKIFFTPMIKSYYYPRSKLRDLFRQFFKYGFWKTKVIKKHKALSHIRHIIPAVFILFLFYGSIFSIISNLFFLLYLGILFSYLFLCIIFSFSNGYADTFAKKITLIYVHFILHISYGLGFLKGMIYEDYNHGNVIVDKRTL